jgi:hypothetical protein
MQKIAVAVAFSVVSLPVVAQETSLAAAAEKQKKARTGQTKVVTESDLRGHRSGYVAAEATGTTGGSADAAKPATPAAPGQKAKTDDELKAEKKAAIEAQMKKWTGFVADTRKSMDLAQFELNDLSSYTAGSRRAGLQKILDEGGKMIAEAEGEIAKLEEEARRAGITVSR